MYAAIQLNDFTTTSRHSVDVVLRASALFGKVREWSGKVGVFIVMHIMVVPFVTILAYFRYQLRKNFPADIKITSNSYADTRKSYDKLMIISALLQPIADAKTIDAPWVLRFALAHTHKVFATIQACIARINTALLELDTIPNETKPRFFQLRTEAELWADRPSCYEYLV